MAAKLTQSQFSQTKINFLIFFECADIGGHFKIYTKAH